LAWGGPPFSFSDARRTTIKPKAEGKIPIFYDGGCGFCQRSITFAQTLDLFQRFEFLNFRSKAVQEKYPDLDTGRNENEILMKEPDGRWYGGFFAVRRMMRKMPVTFLFAPLLYLPGMAWLGVRLYRWVAAHRYLFFGGSAACALKPPEP
jgi:predicted DCC family thiol-disulfide oxidoreductase YuxK